MDFDYEAFDEADPFAGMDYDSLVAWAQENREALIANGIDPDNLLGDNSNRVSLGGFDEISATMKACVPTVLSQSAETMMLPILMSIGLHIFCRLQSEKSPMGHAFSFITGFMILVKLQSFMVASLVLLSILLVINLSMYISRSSMVIVIPLFLVSLEVYFGQVWMTIRGTALVMACKVISLFLNPANVEHIDRDDTEAILAILGYLFHPGTLIFGPWVAFDVYLSAIEAPIFSITSIFAPVFPAALCLLTSTCVFSMFPELPGFSLYRAIVETYSFHASHYYILLSSQAITAVSGMASNGWFTSMIDVAIPYEMNEVCRSWNRPINKFLKEHIFIGLRSKTGRAGAIIGTFFFSALLHGLSFPIFLTLLTLGAASYGEFELRRKFGRYYCLNEVLPTGLYKPKAAPAEIHDEKTQEEISLSYSHYILNLLASPWVFLAYVARKVTNIVKSKAFISFIFNTSFLFVNLTHLFYLGNLFSEPDMKVVNCVKKMADFDFISTKLAIITFFLGYYC